MFAVELQVEARRVGREDRVAYGTKAVLRAELIDNGIDHGARDESAAGPDETVPRAAERPAPGQWNC